MKGFVVKTLIWQNHSFAHSHKKRKDSLETRAERAVLRAHVENQATLKPILLYYASKYKVYDKKVISFCFVFLIMLHI